MGTRERAAARGSTLAGLLYYLLNCLFYAYFSAQTTNMLPTKAVKRVAASIAVKRVAASIANGCVRSELRRFFCLWCQENVSASHAAQAATTTLARTQSFWGTCLGYAPAFAAGHIWCLHGGQTQRCWNTHIHTHTHMRARALRNSECGVNFFIPDLRRVLVPAPKVTCKMAQKVLGPKTYLKSR